MTLHPNDKLIRDRIPEIAAARGEAMSVRTAEPDELKSLAARKLFEEAGEFFHDASIEELGDVIEAKWLAGRVYGYDHERMMDLRRGRFTAFRNYFSELRIMLVGAAWAFQERPSIEHLVTVHEIIYTIVDYPDFGIEAVDWRQKEKRETNGAFDAHLVWRAPSP